MMRVSSAWKYAAASAALALVLVMSSVVGATAVQRRMFVPDFEINVGPARLSAFVTQTPNCRVSSNSYRKSSLCSGQSIYSPDEYFAIWFLFRSRRGTVLYEQARRLAILRLSERHLQ